MTVLEILTVLLISTAIASLALMLTGRVTRKNAAVVVPSESPVAFLFEDGVVVHATPIGQTLLDHSLSDFGWAELRDTFAQRFPKLPASLPPLQDGKLDFPANDPDDSGILRIEALGQHTRLELIETDTAEFQKNRQAAREIGLLHAQLNEVCQNAPFLMWRVDDVGNVVWSNSAYDDLARKVNVEAQAKDTPVLTLPFNSANKRKARVPVEVGKGDKAAWFEVTATQVEDGTLHHATSIDAVIQAEIAQRNFVQTLAKTFAQLSIGLAIFDRNRQLVLFNPALVDLTELRVEVLSARPDLMTFFDHLRDKRTMPEPKNYATWRYEITTMVAAATDGDFQETWSLHGGKTYRVTGRPHPDGALAFLIEDISEEMSKTRNFRAEVKLGHRLLDNFDDAMAVFKRTGALLHCNSVYRELWGQDPDRSFAEMTIDDCVKVWRSQCAPASWLENITDFTTTSGSRVKWSESFLRKNNERLKVLVSPISSGETLVRFQVDSENAHTF